MGKFRNIALTDWVQSGEGVTGKTYRCRHDDTLKLKLFHESFGADYAKGDLEKTNLVAKLGILTARALEVVRCDDCYGVIYERLPERVGLGRYCGEDSRRIPEAAAIMVEELKRLHSIECDTGIFEDRDERLRQILATGTLADSRTTAKLLAWMSALEPATTCLHGNLHPSNLCLCQGKRYWLDFGSFAYGNPIYDLGMLYATTYALNWTSHVQGALHMDRTQLYRFWVAFAEEYTGSKDPQVLMRFERDARYAAALCAIELFDLVASSSLYRIAFKAYLGWFLRKV